MSQKCEYQWYYSQLYDQSHMYSRRAQNGPEQRTCSLSHACTIHCARRTPTRYATLSAHHPSTGLCRSHPFGASLVRRAFLPTMVFCVARVPPKGNAQLEMDEG